MKKIFLSILLITSITILSACNNAPADDIEKPNEDLINDTIHPPVSDANDTPVPEVIQNNDQKASELKELGELIINTYAFPEMYILEKDEIKGEYGVSIENIDEVFAAVPMEYPGIERVFLAKISDSNLLEIAKTELNKTFDTIKAEYIDYLPDEYKKAKDVDIQYKNDILYLIISEDYDSIVSFINE